MCRQNLGTKFRKRGNPLYLAISPAVLLFYFDCHGLRSKDHYYESYNAIVTANPQRKTRSLVCFQFAFEMSLSLIPLATLQYLLVVKRRAACSITCSFRMQAN
jgi:hypothetical protein